MDTYARAPVEFVRGEGARLWDAEGREYLDFFAGLSVHNAGHCHPRIVAAITRAGGALCRQLQPLLHRAGDAAQRAARRVEPRRSRLPVQLRRRGERVRDQARPQARPRAAGSTRPRSSPSTAPSTAAPSGRSPRRRGSPAMTSSGPAARLRLGPARRSGRPARRGRRAHRRCDDRADPGRGGHLPDRRRGPASPPARRATRSARAGLRRGPVRDGEDRDRCGPTSSCRCARTC